MTRLVALTLSDLRGGRESWRVLLLVCGPSFIAACITAALRLTP